MAITDRVIAYYECDDVTDSHSGGHDLTNVNSATFVTGKVGNGVDCDVTNQSGLVLANASAGAFQLGTRSLSVAFWFKSETLPTSGNAGALIVMGSTSSSDAGFHVIFSNSGGSGQFIARMSSGSALYTATSAASYTTGTWYHVRAVWDRSNLLRLYVDGSLVASTSIAAASATNISSTADLQIGGRYASQVWIDGVIDEVMFWDGIMSPDVASIHKNGTTGVSYSTFAAITRPYVDQEFIFEQETNTTSATAVVSDLVADQVALVLLSTDGNTTGASLTAWDSAWTADFDATAIVSSTTFTRFRSWWRVVSSTDASTETQVAASWTSNEKAVLVVQLWGNCASVLASAATNYNSTSGTGSYTAPAVDTTGTDGCQIQVGIAIDAGPTVSSFDAGLTFNDYQVTNSAGHTGLWWGSENQATGGSTGTYAFTMNNSGTVAIPWTIAMEPIAAGAGSVSGTITQGGQTFSGTAEVLVQATGALTQGAVTLSGTAEVLVQASGSLTQGGQVLVGTVGTPALSVSGTITQGAAALSGSAAVTVQASGSLTQGAVSISGSASVLVQLSGSLTQGAATITGSAADPNNSVRDIELSADPYIQLSMTASPLVQITLSAEAYVQ